MSKKPHHRRNRYLIFTRTDELAFTRALYEAFGSFTFYENGPFGHHKLPLMESIADCPSTSVWGFLPQPDWTPITERVERFGYDRLLNVPTRFHFTLDRSQWHWLGIPRMAFDDPTLEEGWITSWFDHDDPEEKAFVRKIWRILDRLTTNQYKVEYPHLGKVLGETKSETWAGHDALRWCSQGKARMLCGRWRPTDDWAFPNLPYYSGLEVGSPPDVPRRKKSGYSL